MTFSRAIGPAFLIFQLTCLTAFGVEAKDPEVPMPPRVDLAEALKNQQTGEHAGADSEKRLQQQAKEYIQYRRGQMSAKRRQEWIAECFANPDKNAFCNFTSLGQRKGKTKGVSRASKPKSRTDVFEIAEKLSKGKVHQITATDEDGIYRALKLHPKWEVLEPAVEKALSSDECPNATLLSALGGKAEEFFPSDRIRDQAMSLYGRAVRCGEPGSDNVSRARYRLGLLKIWEGKYKEAEPILAPLSDQRGGDYTSRSIYWRHHCAKRIKHKELRRSLKKRLLAEFPLSYHALILSHEEGEGRGAIPLASMEPNVQFHSDLKPELTPIVRGVEMLQSLKANELAMEIMNALLSAPYSVLEGTEPAFRLYFAVLMDRSGETLRKFRTLASVFRDDTSAISRGSLELFYPRLRLDVLERYGAKVDPYLSLALIRQESAFNTNARSHVGALGLMQLMPATARRMERVSKREILDPKTNIRLGVRFFNSLLEKYGHDAELALAAYNAGPHRVDDWRQRYTVPNSVLFIDLIPFKETREYVAAIARNYYWYLSLYRPDLVDERLSSGRAPAAAPTATISGTKAKIPPKFSMFTVGAAK